MEMIVNGEAGDIQTVSNKGTKENVNAESDTDPKIAEQLKKKLRAKERSRQKLLANLEKNHYGLFQMLKMDPREISAMHEKLSDKQALIQYLPTKDKLLIQVLTKSGAIIRQVDIGKELLDKKSLESATILRQQSDLLEGNKAEARGIKVKASEISLSLAAITTESHIKHLSWLYHHLIRPIENDLVGKEQVFITPVGALTYVPFSALIRKVTPKAEYLVEKYNIGILPSMYHFNLVMHHSESYSDKGLFIADPDGSLPGARKEVSQIANSFEADKKVLQGSSASFSNFNEELEDSSIIHFATHGVLNTSAPMDSYLLLAKGYQFSVIDISTLDLEQTDLVVLYACESGIGNLGMEYATLARAFAHAKVPTVAASFWMVHDDATKDFMTHFYSQLQDQDTDYFKAMSNAKKKRIAAKSSYSHPAAWASFEIFGKP